MSEVNVTVRGRIGHLELDRPKALNSLNSEMCEAIDKALTEWASDDAIDAVLITSASPKAFCAGGDVRLIRDYQIEGDYEAGDRFFANEYRMNGKLADFPKPYIALIDGIVMGGGLGVSAHGSHRIVTDNAQAAMPEMAIGFVPDVGVPYMTQRMENADGHASPAFALFMGVTGYRLSAADMLWSGLATHYIAADDIDLFVTTLVDEGVDAAVEKCARDHSEAGTPEIARYSDVIERVFATGSWFDIERNLDDNSASAEEFVAKVDNLLANANPSSLVAAVELYRSCEEAPDIHKALDHEYAIGSLLRRSANFQEGVRAVLVDKDNHASFDPHVTDEVDPAMFRQIVTK